MNVVKQLIEKSQEHGKPMYIAFVDYSKPFDLVRHESLWKVLSQQAVPKKYTRTQYSTNKT